MATDPLPLDWRTMPPTPPGDPRIVVVDNCFESFIQCLDAYITP